MFLGLSSSFGQGLRDKKDGTLNPDAFLTCEKEHVPQSFDSTPTTPIQLTRCLFNSLFHPIYTTPCNQHPFIQPMTLQPTNATVSNQHPSIQPTLFHSSDGPPCSSIQPTPLHVTNVPPLIPHPSIQLTPFHTICSPPPNQSPCIQPLSFHPISLFNGRSSMQPTPLTPTHTPPYNPYTLSPN